MERQEGQTGTAQNVIPVEMKGTTAFAECLLSGNIDLAEIGRRLIGIFPAEAGVVKWKVGRDVTEVSPLKSFPGLVRNMALLYRSAGSGDPFSQTWANQIDMNWPLCSGELLNGSCMTSRCQMQHRRDYELSEGEKSRHCHLVGDVDRQILAGNPNASFLNWPITSPKTRLKFEFDFSD